LCAAEDQEAHGVYSGRAGLGLGCQPSSHHPDSMFHDGHHLQRLYACEHLQQRRRRESGGILNIHRYVPPAAGADDLLLFLHCLQTT